MNVDFRPCTARDVDFVLELKRAGLREYLEKLYGWDEDEQRRRTARELEAHPDGAHIIRVDGADAGASLCYEEAGDYVVALLLVSPGYRNRGVATQVLSGYIDRARAERRRIRIATCKDNPALRLYERLGFRFAGTSEAFVFLERDFRARDAAFAAFDFDEIVDMQRRLQQRYMNKWEPVCPETGKNKLLWMIGEAGEVGDVLKKRGHEAVMADPGVRAHFVEEMTDVLMYYGDVMLCFGSAPEELKRAYVEKFEKNMKRW